MNAVVKTLIPAVCLIVPVLCIPGCLIRPTGSDDQPMDRPSLTDTDNDGIPNVTDTDIDNDGTPNTEDNDIDGDRIPNIDDNDIDGDGIINERDSDIDGDGKTNTDDDDIDGDGVINIDDNDIDGDGIPNTEDSDIDGDGIPNDQDSDLDGDGIINGEDNDIDGDGIPNTDDPDIDNDGIPNDQDEAAGGTGNDIDGTQGDTNTDTDVDSGTTNTDTDENTGETSDDDHVSGIAVVAVDTVAYTLKIPTSQGTGTVSTYETIDLVKVRDEIEDNNIALSTVDLRELSIIASASNNFIQANKDTRIVVTVSYLDAGNNKVPVLESADTDGLVADVLTVGDLAAGIELKDEIFAAPEGFSTFTDMVKDESKSSVSTVIDITFLDTPSQGGVDLDVNFIISASGINAM